MLVLAHVSSMKTSRLGSMRAWYFFHQARRRAMSGRSCSLANTVFFEADPGRPQEPPEGVARHLDAALVQFAEQRMQGQIRLLGQSSQQPRPFAVQLADTRPTTHRPGCRAAGRARPLRPLHDAGYAHPEQPGNLTARLAVANRRDDPFPKIQRIGSSHLCWPPVQQTAGITSATAWESLP